MSQQGMDMFSTKSHHTPSRVIHAAHLPVSCELSHRVKDAPENRF